MAGEGKVRKGFYIEEDLLEQVDGLLEQADVKSRNEFLNHRRVHSPMLAS